MTASTRWVLQLARIISGMQSGADVGALVGARAAGVATGGWAPKGWLTEGDPQEAVMRDFGLRECPEPGYPARTRRNVADCDAVLIVGYRSSGSILTEKLAKQLGKPCLWLLWHEQVQLRDEDINRLELWMKKYNPETLMVAGNRESRNPGIAVRVRELVRKVLLELKGEGSSPAGGNL